MIAKNPKGIALLAMVAILLAVSGCGTRARVGELQTGSETVESGGAASVRVEIEMAAGELDVSGGAAELLEADFTYNVAELKPAIDFDGSTLSVRTPDFQVRAGSLWDLRDYRYEWDLRLNDDVAMDMKLGTGAGRSNLQLGTLSLTRLEVTRGAGEVVINLSGSTSLASLKVGGGAGTVTVDLTGDWQNDLEATIEGGVGESTLILPSDVGVRVQVDVGVGGVDTTGLTKQGEYYTNDVYAQSDVTLYIEVEGGIGGTELIVRE